MAASYVRRIGSQEARDGRIAVLKSAVRTFPPVGERFRVLFQGRTAEVTLESYPCTCRGPEKPHQHWYIPWPGLQAGQTILFERGEDGAFEVSLAG